MTIVFYDGVCILCNGFIKFIFKFDKAQNIKVTPLQSEKSIAILSKYNLDFQSLDTIFVLDHEKIYMRSDAVLVVLSKLSIFWKCLSKIGFIIPKFLRDFLYNIVAKNRYKTFGQYDSCPLPTPEMKNRFL
jgi:predicted DCC family thiol-disulfide oxidoreductase YuxK